MTSRTSNIGQISAPVIKETFRKVNRDLFSFRPQSIKKAPDRIARLRGCLEYQDLKKAYRDISLLHALDPEKNVRSALDQHLLKSPENYSRQPLEYLPIEVTMRLLLGKNTALKGLQLASNYGPYLLYLKERRGFTDFSGIDIDPHAVQYAREIGSPVIEGSVNPLPFESSSFDLVISNNFLVMDYAPVERTTSLDLPTFIRSAAEEVHRVLKPGGYFISLDECVHLQDEIPFDPPQIFSREVIAELESLGSINVFQKAA
jgi:SAM-dependent methyltransferase